MPEVGMKKPNIAHLWVGDFFSLCENLLHTVYIHGHSQMVSDHIDLFLILNYKLIFLRVLVHQGTCTCPKLLNKNQRVQFGPVAVVQYCGTGTLGDVAELSRTDAD